MDVMMNTGPVVLTNFNRDERLSTPGAIVTPEPSTGSDRKTRLRRTPQGEKRATSEQSPLPEGEKLSGNDDTQQPQRTLRERKSTVSKRNLDDVVEQAIYTLTDEERQNWKGWVELESDPALFGYILRQYGVKDVMVQEVVGLDEVSLSYLPQPVYGLIFLFRYHDADAEEEDDAPKCPNHVWFANQTTNNACATVAMLNIVMNNPDINMGDALQSFKQSTNALKPPVRGKTLSENEFIRKIHNSFLRRMDVLNADWSLQNDHEKWVKANKNPKKKPTPKRKTYNKKKDEDAAYHFVAYVPINNDVWRLDGLQRQPVNIGAYVGDWVSLARDNIIQRIIKHGEGNIDYSLMALCRGPLLEMQTDLVENAREIIDVERSLEELIPDWKLYLQSDKAMPLEDLAGILNITVEQIICATRTESAGKKLEEIGSDPQKVMELYTEGVLAQKALRSKYLKKISSIAEEDELTARRNEDHSPVVYRALKALSEAGVLKGIVRDLRGK